MEWLRHFRMRTEHVPKRGAFSHACDSRPRPWVGGESQASATLALAIYSANTYDTCVERHLDIKEAGLYKPICKGLIGFTTAAIAAIYPSRDHYPPLAYTPKPAHAMAQDGQTSINIPQLIAVAVVGFLALRWFMSKPPTSGAASSRRNTIDVSKIEQVSAVFPQLDRRSIAWDLQRNGGNVEATMERVLGGRGLESPPPSFQPTLPSPVTTQNASGSAASGRKQNAPLPDLITRYNLQSRVSGKGKEPVPSEEQKRNAWSADKGARADALRKRREEMILAARRKMEEKERQA